MRASKNRMRDHELELIAALAEGRLEDESEARALIESSSEHREEYEAQQRAVAALAGVTSADLTDYERASLRRDIWTELRTPAAPAVTTQPWYYRWAPVAAGLFMLVGLVAVINNQGGSDGATPLAAEFDTDTSTTSADTEGSGSGEDGAQGEGGATPGDSEETPTSVTTSGAIEIDELVAADLSRALSAADNAFYATEADEIRATDETDPETDDAAQTRLSECVDEAGISDYSIVGAYPVTSEDEPAPEDANPYIVVKPADVELAVAPLAFVDTISCEVIYVDE